MMAAVVALLVGQAGVRGSARTALFAVAFVAVMHVHVVFVEEPTLTARFGDPYVAQQPAAHRPSPNHPLCGW
ncbi:hypothetical protein I4F81_009435 [Pyropia yezoensis]|uniref:Uncharacterized protein n=1 Tax=Pyropia yezoensis TaxID=2788 RepID=A0ACC3CAM2_PYRYE|nr:hypothetical protein I4F81_009435 [Neopyropia yezoensis]